MGRWAWLPGLAAQIGLVSRGQISEEGGLQSLVRVGLRKPWNFC
jgi:hypothetical protein